MNLDSILADLRSERDRLDKAIAALEGTSARAPRKRRHMSAAARKRISLAQKARWAKQKRIRAA